MLSLSELRRAVRVLEARISGHRLQAVAQPDGQSVVLTTYGGGSQGQPGGRHHVRVSCRPGCARVSLCPEPPKGLPKPGAFVQYLRAHVVGARVGGARLVDDDRQLAFELQAREGQFDLLLTIFGERSNTVLLDARGCILSALRPLAETRPELGLGEPWCSPTSRPPTAGEDRFSREPDEGYLEAVEAFYAARERSEEAAALQRRVESVLRKQSSALERKLAKLTRELDQARNAAGFERQGELLKGVLSRVRKGDTEVVARDYETNQDVAIPLDPTRSPSENLEHLFKRYRKAIRGLAKAGAQHEAVQGARDELRATAEEFRSLVEGSDPADLGELEAFAARPAVRRLLAKYAPTPPAHPSRPGADRGKKLAGRKVPGRLLPRRYRTAGGLEIWVGRSDAGNDHLSTRLARGKDLFFHLDGAPGSHVVLRTEGRADPPPESLLDACELAVHFSKLRNASRADVHVVPIKNVKKPKGAKTGLVLVHGGKTIHLRRASARLERVLASRIED
jgi:predicted ribosome quality control (RQC) complex YloA/Tae2 family protein